MKECRCLDGGVPSEWTECLPWHVKPDGLHPETRGAVGRFVTDAIMWTGPADRRRAVNTTKGIEVREVRRKQSRKELTE